MSEEELNKKMEFIVEHQARFAAEIEIMREVQAAEATRLKDALIGLVEIVGSLTRAQTSADVRANLLEDAFSRLAWAQAKTEESLKALINTVERHIGGNGGSHSHA